MKKILRKEKERQDLITELMSFEKMVQGSFCCIHVKCGKNYCACNKGKLHPHWRMSISRDGQSYSRAVPKEDYVWIKEMTENYKNFRNIRRKINKLDREIMKLINEYEKKLTKKTIKGKEYLKVGKQ